MVLALLAVVLVGGGAFLLLSGDDDDDGEGPEQVGLDGGDAGSGTEGGLDGSPDDPERAAYVEAIAEATDTSSFPGEISEDQVTCIAEMMVDVVGLDRLSESVTPDEIRADPDWELGGPDPTREQAEAIASGMNQCIDFTSLMADTVISEGGMPAGAEDCVQEAVTDEVVEDMLAAEIMEEDTSSFEATLQQDMMDCMLGS